jgi:hypothetical protein
VLEDIGLVQAVLDDAEHDVVGQELAVVEVLLGLAPEVSALEHGFAEHVPGGDVGRAVVLGQQLALRPLAGPLSAEHDQADATHYFRNPS